MKIKRHIVEWLTLLALATLNTQLSTAYPQGVITTNWNTLTNWTQTSAPGTEWKSIASSSDGTKLAAVVSVLAIYTSTNTGVTWVQTSAPGEDWESIACSSDGTHLMAGSYPGIWTSTNAGVSWTQTGAPMNTNWYSIACSSNGTKLAAVVLDGGEIWTAQATILPTTGTFAGIVMDAPIGWSYLIQTASNLTGNWMTLTNVALPWNPYLYIDARSATNSQQFYRAVPAP